MKRKFLEELPQGIMPRRRASEDEWEDDMEEGGCQGQMKGGGQQRNAANARERARMRVLSRAFCRLKTTLPWVPADTKLSKLDTLRLATSYIAHLRAVLCLDRDDHDHHQPSPIASLHPLNLTWPFSFQTPPAVSPSPPTRNLAGCGVPPMTMTDGGDSWVSSEPPRHSVYERTSHDRTTEDDFCQPHIVSRDQQISAFHSSSFHDSLMQIG